MDHYPDVFHSGYQVGYFIGQTLIYLLLSWITVLFARPNSTPKVLVDVAAISTILLILNTYGSQSPESTFFGGLPIVPIVMAVVWLAYRKRLTPENDDEITKLGLGVPVENPASDREGSPPSAPGPNLPSDDAPSVVAAALDAPPVNPVTDACSSNTPSGPSHSGDYPSLPQQAGQPPAPPYQEYPPYQQYPQNQAYPPYPPYPSYPPDQGYPPYGRGPVDIPDRAPYAIPPDAQQYPPPMQYEPFAASYARVPSSTFQPVDKFGPTSPRTLGMLAAGTILIVNAVFGLIGWIFLAAASRSSAAVPGPVVYLIDALVAFGLFRGTERFRQYALVRAVLGGVLYAAVVPAITRSSFSWVDAAAQIAFAFGLIVLLYGATQPSIRVAMGVLVVLLAWGTLITSGFIQGFVQSFGNGRIAQWSVPNRSFIDEDAGIRLDLPNGWVLLSNSNPYVNIPGAKAIAFDKSSGCFAALVVEPALERYSNVDRYVELVVQSRQKAVPSLVETGRDTVRFADSDGRRVYTQWTRRDQSYKGFSTASGDALNYYLLSGWNTSSKYSRSLEAFKTLEAGFKLTKSADARLDEKARKLQTEMPYLSESGAKRLILAMVRQGNSEDSYSSSAFQFVSQSFRLLPASEQAEFSRLQDQAFSGISRGEYTRYKNDERVLARGGELGEYESSFYNSMLPYAFETLPPEPLHRAQQVCDDAINSGLNTVRH